MDDNGKRQIALHAPNIVNICVDSYEGGEASGRIYHCYKEEATPFANIIQLIEVVEEFFDRISFPQASTQTRAFIKIKRQKKEDWQKIVEPQKAASQRGKVGSFLMHVKYRQNSSWQGEVEWQEKENIQEFMSVLELLKILNNALGE